MRKSFIGHLNHGVRLVFLVFENSMDNNSLAKSINGLSVICTTGQLKTYQVKSSQNTQTNIYTTRTPVAANHQVRFVRANQRFFNRT